MKQPTVCIICHPPNLNFIALLRKSVFWKYQNSNPIFNSSEFLKNLNFVRTHFATNEYIWSVNWKTYDILTKLFVYLFYIR